MLAKPGAQARENPMALAMIGAGMAWLMMGRNDAVTLSTAARLGEARP